MAEFDKVADAEELYRSIRVNSDEYRYDEGKLIFSSQAFVDRNKEPSVDRAVLLKNNPVKSKRGETDGIVTLVTYDVRCIGDVYSNDDAGLKVNHAVDVIPRPEPCNESHAQIEVTPEYFGSNNKKNRAFKLLRISLARQATNNGWTIAPE